MGILLALQINNDNDIIKRWVNRFTSENTIRRYSYVVKNFFNVTYLEQITNQMIKNITDIDIEKYIERLAEENKSRSSIKNTKECLKSLFTFAKNKRIIKESVLDDKSLNSLIKLKTKNDSNKIIGKALSPEQINELINIIDDQRDRLLMLLMLRTGIRVSEVISIKWNNIEFNTQENAWFLNLYGKGRKFRQVYISYKMIEELTAYANQNNLIIGLSRELIFPMSRTNVNRIVEKWGKAINIKISPHDLRRTACTYLLKKNVPMVNVKNFLGHAKIETTMMYFKEYNSLKNNAGKFIDY